MRALVLGARGAVGDAVVRELERRGHDAIRAGRQPSAGGVTIDVESRAGLAALEAHAAQADAVVDATGTDSPEVWRHVGATPLIDVSATAEHIERVARTTGTVVRGTGIAPGISTSLVAALDAQPGDDVDVAVMLGAGEQHGAAAVEWTVRLAGAAIAAAPENARVVNLRSRRPFPALDGDRRTRRFLRADFPDDVLIGREAGTAVRSWLALDSRLATAALRVVGAAPALAPLLRRAPHLGGSAWSVTVVHRRTGRTLRASGEGQSVATGRVAAHVAERVVAADLRGPLTAADVIDVAAIAQIPGVTVSRTTTPRIPSGAEPA